MFFIDQLNKLRRFFYIFILRKNPFELYKTFDELLECLKLCCKVNNPKAGLVVLKRMKKELELDKSQWSTVLVEVADYKELVLFVDGAMGGKPQAKELAGAGQYTLYEPGSLKIGLAKKSKRQLNKRVKKGLKKED